MNRAVSRFAWAAGLAAGAIGLAACQQGPSDEVRSSEAVSAAPSDPPPAAVPPPSATTRDAATIAEAPSGTAPNSAADVELPIPPSRAFVVDRRFPECVHPGVVASCEDGWCRIPSGCFIWGSPEAESGRVAKREEQGPVTLTHDFEMKQYEVTLEEWAALDFPPDPIPSRADCQDATCPMTDVTWTHAALYANALSAAHDPPFEACYTFEDCQVNETKCTPGMTRDTVYECEGYRFPTRAEWQYATRAGTTTAFYSGDMSVTVEQEGAAMNGTDTGCDPTLHEPALDPIAWYCINSGHVSHPVGGKLPNAWNLYDMTGNVDELLHDVDYARSPDFPAADPFGEIGEWRDGRPYVGGAAISWPSLLRIASGLQTGADSGGGQIGFRLARTLGPGKPPTLDDVPVANGRGSAPE
jgi:formylglycine-generating enzyme required for sulfatase activity